MSSYESIDNDYNNKSNVGKESGSIGVIRIIIYVILYLLFIFIAQSWISTFIAYYNKYVIRKEKPEPKDLFILSLALTIIFIILVYLLKPTLPLFKQS